MTNGGLVGGGVGLMQPVISSHLTIGLPHPSLYGPALSMTVIDGGTTNLSAESLNLAM